MESKKFQRKIEDFECENCGQKVHGDGYTNHCPNCLWSKHVDINPGDRESNCLGMMEPIGVIYRAGGYIVRQKCTRCKVVKNIKSSLKDNKDQIIKLSLKQK